MTPEAQRIAIAKACGWTQRTEGMMWSASLNRAAIVQGSHLESVRRKMKLPMDNGVMLPDYINDLNAIHDAEETLNDLPEFCQHLAAVVFYPLTNAHESNKLWQGWWFVHATAAQRCEALLRTIGKWDDTK